MPATPPMIAAAIRFSYTIELSPEEQIVLPQGMYHGETEPQTITSIEIEQGYTIGRGAKTFKNLDGNGATAKRNGQITQVVVKYQGLYMGEPRNRSLLIGALAEEVREQVETVIARYPSPMGVQLTFI